MKANFRYSVRTLLAAMTVAAILALLVGKSELASYLAAACASLLLMAFAHLFVVLIVTFGIVLPVVIVVATPVILIAAFFLEDAYLQNVWRSYINGSPAALWHFLSNCRG